MLRALDRDLRPTRPEWKCELSPVPRVFVVGCWARSLEQFWLAAERVAQWKPIWPRFCDRPLVLLIRLVWRATLGAQDRGLHLMRSLDAKYDSPLAGRFSFLEQL